MVHKVGKTHRKAILSWVADGVDVQAFAKESGFSSAYIQRAKRAKFNASSFFEGKYKHGVVRSKKLWVLLSEAVVSFFRAETNVRSGASCGTLEVDQQLCELRMGFFASFPRYLRDVAVRHPQVLTDLRKSVEDRRKINKFSLALLHSVNEANIVDDELQYTLRRKYAVRMYEVSCL